MISVHTIVVVYCVVNAMKAIVLFLDPTGVKGARLMVEYLGL